ncbi:hypothetical protein MC885_011501 [Smutsia gigantea]|nr:hypothetical protein MC885_011501 [Smutsia gigantea]
MYFRVRRTPHPGCFRLAVSGPKRAGRSEFLRPETLLNPESRQAEPPHDRSGVSTEPSRTLSLSHRGRRTVHSSVRLPLPKTGGRVTASTQSRTGSPHETARDGRPVPDNFVLGVIVIQGHINGVHLGRMAVTGFHTEVPIQGCDTGKL